MCLWVDVDEIIMEAQINEAEQALWCSDMNVSEIEKIELFNDYPRSYKMVFYDKNEIKKTAMFYPDGINGEGEDSGAPFEHSVLTIEGKEV